MKFSHFLILLVCSIIIGTAGWLVQHQRQKSWQSAASAIGQELFAELPINDVDAIKISGPDASVDLQKNGDFWVVATSHSYYADFVRIADFLKKLKELKALQTIDIGREDYDRLELNEPGKGTKPGILVEIFAKNDKNIARLVLGKKHMKQERENASPFAGGTWPDGRYIRETQSQKVVLVSEPFANLMDSNDTWWDKSFIRVEKLKQASAYQGEQELWSVYRDQETDPLKLKGEIPADEELAMDKINGIDSALRYPGFNQIADPVITDEAHGLGADTRSFVVQSFNGITYTFRIGKKNDKDEYPLKLALDFNEPTPPTAPSEESEADKVKREDAFKMKIDAARDQYEKESARYQNWVFIVSSYTVDDMVLERKDLTKKKAAPAAAPPEDDEESDDNWESMDSLEQDADEEMPLPAYPTPLLQPPPDKISPSTTSPPPAVDTLPPLPTAPALEDDAAASDSEPAANP